VQLRSNTVSEILGVIIDSIAVDLAFAAGSDAHVVDAVRLVPVSVRTRHGVHIRVLLNASGGPLKLDVKELAGPVFDLWVTHSLVEGLRKVALVKEVEDEALRVDTDATVHKLRHRRAAVHVRVAGEKAVLSEIHAAGGALKLQSEMVEHILSTKLINNHFCLN
jgi:hypothetical protein